MILSFLNWNCSNSSDLINLNKASPAWCKLYITPLPPHLVPTSIAFHFFSRFFYFTFPPWTLFLAFSSFHERGLGWSWIQLVERRSYGDRKGGDNRFDEGIWKWTGRKKKEKRNCSFNFGDLKCEFVSPVM